MARKAFPSLVTEHREARKIVAELGALLGGPGPDGPELIGEEAMSVTATKTVRELAVEIPNATRVFERLGIDYCCAGHKPLEEACADANLSIDRVLLALEQGVDASRTEPSRVWSIAPLPELIDHIVGKHHTFVKSEVPRLQALIAKVVGVHGKNHPELETVRTAFGELADELAAHLMKEEQILFPYIRKMAAGGTCGSSCFGSVQNPIRMMIFEHDNAGGKLRQMRETTRNYTLPADACFSYGTLFSALVEFEADLHQHIHLENNILFPRAVDLEGRA